jgi:uncharacterized membrane-anchored protein YhcB (DUF1043 family)
MHLIIKEKGNEVSFVYDFIFNVLPTQGPIIPSWIPVIGGMPASSFAGSLLGVLAGYLLAKGSERYLNVQKRAKWMKLIRQELKRAHEDLVKHERAVSTFFVIHNDLLKSLIASNDLSLFSANEAIALALIYTRTNNYVENIRKTNNQISQIKYRTSPDNPNYIPLLRRIDLLRATTSQEEAASEINWIEGELQSLEASVNVDTEIMSFSGIEYGKKMKMIIEAILRQDWVQDEKKHWFFPRHMSKEDEALIDNLPELPLVPKDIV